MLFRLVVERVIADLPYIYSTEGKIKEPNLAAEAGQGLLSAVGSYARGDMVRSSSSVFPMHQSLIIVSGRRLLVYVWSPEGRYW